MNLFDRAAEPEHVRLRPRDRRVHNVLRYDSAWTNCGAPVTRAALYVQDGVNCEACLEDLDKRAHPTTHGAAALCSAALGGPLMDREPRRAAGLVWDPCTWSHGLTISWIARFELVPEWDLSRDCALLVFKRKEVFRWSVMVNPPHAFEAALPYATFDDAAKAGYAELLRLRSQEAA